MDGRIGPDNGSVTAFELGRERNNQYGYEREIPSHMSWRYPSQTATVCDALVYGDYGPNWPRWKRSTLETSANSVTPPKHSRIPRSLSLANLL